MIVAVTTTTATEAFYQGIKVTTESGAAAKLDTQDQGLEATVDNGTGELVLSELREYTDANGKVGHEFDATVRNRTAGASAVTATGDADNDAGELRPLSITFNITTTEPEAGAFTLPEPTIQPIA